jgi:hypothetical protein
MTATDPRARSVPLLGAGMAAGAVLAVLTMRAGGGALIALVTALPFLLAALTGMAKTTTA